MKVLTIGSERNLFVNNSEAQKRIREYGKLFEELHIIVFAHKNLGYKNINISENIFIYPTDHKYKFLYLWRIYKIAKSIIAKPYTLNPIPWVITCQDPMVAGLAGWLLKIFFSVPLQFQLHADIFSPYFGQESWKNKIGVLLAKFLLPKADSIRVVSERIKQSLASSVKRQAPRITTLPIFVDVKKIQSSKIKADLHQKYSNYDFIILMASRLTREKNIGMAIEAMAEVCKAQSAKRKILLLIVGSGPEENKLRLAICDLRLADRIVIEPWTNDLASYYKTADLFLLTSNYEGYGRTVVEAMAAGLPVIMTDVGLAGEVLIDDLDGRVIPVGNVEALAATILELQENSAKREEFKLNSLKLLEKWQTKQEYLEKYKKSLSIN